MRSIDQYLADVRAKLNRVAPEDFEAVVDAGAFVVDIRPSDAREREGELPGAVVVERNVLEWRLSPLSDAQEYDLDASSHVIIVCREGYQSSLAAATLQELGLPNATDLIGGYQALHEKLKPSESLWRVGPLG